MLRRVNLRLALMALLLGVLIAVGAALWYILTFRRQDSESALMGYVNQYAPSVAFVVVDYWLRQGIDRFITTDPRGLHF